MFDQLHDSEPDTLPAEMTDNIIDFLYDDHDSLKSCSLVCRSWRYAARYHLFDTVQLDFRVFSSFLELLKTNSDIGKLVNSIRVTIRQKKDLHAFETIATHLGGVKALYLFVQYWELMPPAALLPHIGPITTFSIECEWSTPSLKELADVLAALPRVTRLRLGIDRFTGSHRGTALADTLADIHLESLAVYGHCDVLADCFRRNASAIPNALEFDTFDTSAWRSLPELLREMSTQLEVLRLSIHDRSTSGDISDLVSALEDCSTLKRLRLKVSFMSLGNVQDFLSHIHIPNLRELHMIFDFANDYFRSTPIERIDTIVSNTGTIAGILDREQFRGLTTISFSFLADFVEFERPSFESKTRAACGAIRERTELSLRFHYREKVKRYGMGFGGFNLNSGSNWRELEAELQR
ncbi:hypothetical protein CERSUDRAFT_103477 [Gelatoporia subvermispora B]|uniref:F-box domain-containing protein n=1 Tax=Ceriporiopsis subvermispora (strain B) TaxID=914234 RepID=M2RRX1_CERS8|nr:hypothetical protein CERSUDRAFT_103477 [Gelatoporia subvermispora B]